MKRAGENAVTGAVDKRDADRRIAAVRDDDEAVMVVVVLL